MKKPYRFFLPIAIAAMTLSGCSSEANEPEATGRKDCPAFTATIGGPQSRAIDSQWEEGDKIGISGCNRSNVCHHTPDSQGSFTVTTEGQQIYFQDDSEQTFTAYYPYTELSEGTSVISADTKTQWQQKVFDFLWARGSGKKDSPKVNFMFAHCMTKVVFTVRPGDGMSFEEMKGVRLSLSGFHHTGSFNLADGTTTVGNDTGNWTFSDFATYNETQGEMTFSLIFFPQVHDAPLTFSAQLNLTGANSLNLSAPIDFTAANNDKDGASARNEWVAGRQYNLSLTLHKTSIAMGDCIINPWNSVTPGDDISVD